MRRAASLLWVATVVSAVACGFGHPFHLASEDVTDGGASGDGAVMDGVSSGADSGANADGGAGACEGADLYAYGGHCYRFVRSELQWASAESDCVAWGGHLVSIHSTSEQTFVANIVAQVDQEGPDASLYGGI
jgi:hypothetical protein